MHFAEQGESRGEPIILLHGYSDSWFSFSRVLTPLAREARVYALDLRGHGKSDQPAAGYGMRDLAADVVAFAVSALNDKGKASLTTPVTHSSSIGAAGFEPTTSRPPV